MTALGSLHATAALPAIQDLLTDDWPTMRAGALRAAAQIDPDAFLLTLSGMEPDRHWIVRAALADVLGSLSAEVATERVRALLERSGHAGHPGGDRRACALERTGPGSRPAQGAWSTRISVSGWPQRTPSAS